MSLYLRWFRRERRTVKHSRINKVFVDIVEIAKFYNILIWTTANITNHRVPGFRAQHIFYPFQSFDLDLSVVPRVLQSRKSCRMTFKSESIGTNDRKNYSMLGFGREYSYYIKSTIGQNQRCADQLEMCKYFVFRNTIVSVGTALVILGRKS